SLQAQLTYLQCRAISCLVPAAKAGEEAEAIPSVKMLTAQSSCKRSPAEVLRMARIRLEKLRGDLCTATPVGFLCFLSSPLLRATALAGWPWLVPGLPQRKPSLHVAVFTRQLQHWMACHQLVQLRGSTLVLVIITLELDRLTAAWLPITDLLKKAQ
ncbi:CCNI2 protein, partial [Upupa epops]|nr:CCNI2 protein [Upupa epops]